MQTNLLGKRATAQINALNPKANGNRDWQPVAAGDTYWVRQAVSVEIVGAFVAMDRYPYFLVMDDGGTIHEVEPRNLTLPPPAHPYR